jgi:hypothetical protein
MFLKILGVYTDDFFAINISDNKITKLPMKGNTPCPRSNHSSLLYFVEQNPYLIIFGGCNRDIEFNDIFRCNLNTYTWESIVSNHILENIKGRAHHTANLIQLKYMVIFGGESDGRLTEDIYIFNLHSMLWKSYAQVKNNLVLKARAFHCSCQINDKIYIFFGCDEEYICFNEIIILDFQEFCMERNEDILIQVLNFDLTLFITPFPRWGCCCYKFSDKEIILFGGRNKIDFNDLWIYNIDTIIWKEIEFNKIGSYFPLPRRKACMTIYENILLIFGGYNCEYFQDFNIMNLNYLKSISKINCRVIKLLKMTLDNRGKNLENFYETVMIKNKQKSYYCIKNLLFSRFSLEEIKNPIIFEIFWKNKKQIDFSHFNITDDVVESFIELFYIGGFVFHKKLSTLILICDFLSSLNLTRIKAVMLRSIIKYLNIPIPYIQMSINYIKTNYNVRTLIYIPGELFKIENLTGYTEIFPSHLYKLMKASKEIQILPKDLSRDIEYFLLTRTIKNECDSYSLPELLYFCDFLNFEILFQVFNFLTKLGC